MALHYVTLEELRLLDDGRIAEAFAQEMKRVVSDCEDRPGEERPRQVTLMAELSPVRDEEGRCDGVTAKFQIRGAIPTRRSKTYSFGLKAGGKLYFSDESPENVAQTTFADLDPESGKVRRELPE